MKITSFAVILTLASQADASHRIPFSLIPQEIIDANQQRKSEGKAKTLDVLIGDASPSVMAT